MDIIERLPTPFGLVRSGVAPDHPETKARCFASSHACCQDLHACGAAWIATHVLGMLTLMHAAQNVINQFTRLGQDPRVRFLGNVAVNADISLQELRRHYHAVRCCPSFAQLSQHTACIPHACTALILEQETGLHHCLAGDSGVWRREQPAAGHPWRGAGASWQQGLSCTHMHNFLPWLIPF